MKTFILSLLAVITLLSCHDKEENTLILPNEACDVKTDIHTPADYQINTIGTIGFNGSIEAFQFVNENVGYAVASKVSGSYVGVLKTVDGGNHWVNLDLTSSQYPISMVFKNENYGLISVQDVTGCPDNCLNKCVALKTDNGGATWQEIEYANLKGILYHLKYDQEGNLYASLFLDGHSTLVKSADDGLSWDTLFSSPDLAFQLVTFSFELYQDKIFVSATNGDLVVIDKNGNFIKTIKTNVSSIWDLKIIDDNNIIVVASAKVIKSSNGGVSWETVYDASARLIDFKSATKGLMLLNKSYCPSDVYQANDLIASTDNGGLSWAETPETTTNLLLNYVGTQKMGAGRYLVLVGDKLMEIKEN